MTTNKNLEMRIEDIELQVESLMEQQIRMDRLLTRIEGGMTAMKWLGAILGIVFTLWEVI
jgi:chaperonin cofactor prefoldin